MKSAPLAVMTASALASSAFGLTDAEKNLAIDSFNKAYYVVQNGAGYFVQDTTRKMPDRTRFWQSCEQIEVIEDAFDRTQNPVYKKMVSELLNGFNTVISGTPDWASWNKFNDDIMWGVIALTRGYRITGNKAFLTQAEDQFNKVWDRGWDDKLGGGLYWTTDNESKNACINGPATIAAMLLAKETSSKTFRRRADQTYSWLRSHLFNPETGRIQDHQKIDGTLVDWAFTYNQGTFIGAATLLYQDTNDKAYLQDGKLAAHWSMENLTGRHLPGIVHDEYRDGENNGDGAGFKGILARWCGRYATIADDGEIKKWLTLNAETAWKFRNSSNVMWGQMWRSAPDTGVTSWESSGAVSFTQNAP